MENHKGKIVPIPGLQQRLIDKGMDALKAHNVSEAISLLLQAKELGNDSEDLYYALIAAYMEKGNNNEAKNICHEMLKNGIGDYIKTVEIYISILFQLHDYEPIVQLLKPLIEENEIPYHKIEQFKYLLQLSEKMSVNSRQSQETSNSDEVIEDLFSGDFQEVLLRVSKLADKNIQPYINEISNYLRDEQQSPFIKTVLLNVLKEHQYSKKITVKKYGETLEVYPETLHPLHGDKLSANIKQLIKDQVENEHPALIEPLYTLIDRFFFHIYPIDDLPFEPNVWAAAFFALVQSYFEENPKHIQVSAKEFEAERHQVEEAIQYIKKVESNSHF